MDPLKGRDYQTPEIPGESLTQRHLLYGFFFQPYWRPEGQKPVDVHGTGKCQSNPCAAAAFNQDDILKQN
jgi:hypothetical protein